MSAYYFYNYFINQRIVLFFPIALIKQIGCLSYGQICYFCYHYTTLGFNLVALKNKVVESIKQIDIMN